jgi:hypothetical protein
MTSACLYLYIDRCGYNVRMKLLTILMLIPTLTFAESESYYQNKYCKGVTEHVLHDRTRVDCLTDTHAIEYDFSKKWHEAIGQSLGYAFETNKRAGIVLIVEKKKDYKHWIKLNSIIKHYNLPIDTWIVSD